MLIQDQLTQMLGERIDNSYHLIPDSTDLSLNQKGKESLPVGKEPVKS